MNKYQVIIEPLLKYYPETQAIYLFGSYGTGDEWTESDIDVAVLMPVRLAKRIKSKELIELSSVVAQAAGRETADLINAREVNVVFRKEIISGRRIYCADKYAADEFEMLTLPLYQQLQEERKDIIKSVII